MVCILGISLNHLHSKYYNLQPVKYDNTKSCTLFTLYIYIYIYNILGKVIVS